MRKSFQSSHAISGVFVFLLLGIFAVFSTVMVMMGAKAYRGTVDRLETHNAVRIAPAYIRSMVRGDDEADVLTCEEVDGVSAITMMNDYDDESYITRIYCYEGQLYEWFSSAENEFIPADGEPVCPCDGMIAVLEDGLVRVTLLNGEEETNVDIAIKSVR